jgi:RNA polymerase primary sigma factor
VPDLENHILNHEWDQQDRAAARRDLLRLVVSASMRPMSQREVLTEAARLLDEAWAWWDVAELKAEMALWPDDEVIQAGKDFTITRAPSGIGESFKRLRQARNAAAILAEVLPEPLVPSTGYSADDGLFETPLLTPEAERRLGLRAQRGDRDAINRLVEANTRLAMSIVMKYRRSETFGIDDMFQEACLGLIRAAEKFDPRTGNRFSTYATWWIRQAIARARAEKSRTIRLPVHIVEHLNKVRAAEWKLERSTGRPAKTEEIATMTDLKPEKVAEIRRVEATIVPLDAAEHAFDRTAATPEDEVLEMAGRWALERLIGDLHKREADVIRRRNGLGCEPQTLEAVGQVYGVTRERIRQIESSAMKQMTVMASEAPAAPRTRGNRGARRDVMQRSQPAPPFAMTTATLGAVKCAGRPVEGVRMTA